MKKVNHDDWEEDLRREPICVRAINYSSLLASLSIFTLEYPEQLRVGDMYFSNFSTSIAYANMQRFEKQLSNYGLKKDELLVESSQLVFIKIAVQIDVSKLEFDIIINLTESGFPSAGILGRESEPWERSGDPLGEAKGTYEALASHLHYSVPSDPAYPAIAVNKTTDLVVGTHLLPRPRLGRSLKLPPEKAKPVQLREYVLKIMVEIDATNQDSRKKRRIL